MLGNFKPKVLFQKGQNPTVTCKKPLKNTSARVRAVASRFSLAAAPTDELERKRRKWSLPEPFKVKNGGTEGELNGSVIHLSGETQVDPLLTVGSPPSIMKIAAMLPRIRTLHGASESPRNSGCAKRVAQLVGKKHHFSMQHDEVSVVSPTHPIHRTLNPS
ncbi:hypothetical protein HPP92_010841 [Vanilla planifolia]|uniref:Uncharacterized protein n=1 Tax=Vanilla planifolia TaxID=51239 RepID=A0A835RB88_VANPL|nr:hypothetical protein HPP92_010841 [Vanilla planifolia]